MGNTILNYAGNTPKPTMQNYKVDPATGKASVAAPLAPAVTAKPPAYIPGTGSEPGNVPGSGFNVRGTATPPTPAPAAGTANPTSFQNNTITPQPLPKMGYQQNYQEPGSQQAPTGTPPADWDRKKVYTQEEIGKMTDPYQQAIAAGNLAGIDTSGMPMSDIEAAQQQLASKKKNESALDQQIKFEESQVQQQGASQTAAVQSQLAQSREGIVSQGNTQATAAIVQNLQATVNQHMSQLQETQRQQAEASKNGDFALAGKLGANIAQQQQAVIAAQKATQDAMDKQQTQSMKLSSELKDSGVLAGADYATLQAFSDQYGISMPVLQAMAKSSTAAAGNKEQQQQFENQNKALGTFKDLVSNGTPITLSLAQNWSAQTGLPVDSLLSFNQSAQAVMLDKNLDAVQKKQVIQEMGYKLDQEKQGIFTEQARNIDYIKNLYKSGDVESAKNMERALHIDDLSYQADVDYKAAQTEYQKSQTAENYANMQEKQRAYLDLNGESSGGYLPTKSIEGIKSSFVNGKLQIDCKTPYQCGAFVNRVWGLPAGSSPDVGMGSTLAEKTRLVENNGVSKKEINAGNFYDSVKPGMAFVTSYAGTGHTGIVTAVYPDGSYDTMEANVGDNNPNTPDPPRPGHRSWKDGNLVGFANPPQGSFESIRGGKQDTAVNKYMKEAKEQGITDPEVAKKYAEDKALKELGNKTSDNQIPVAERTKLQNDDSVKKVKSANNFDLALKAYEDLVNKTADLETYGENRSKLDAAYSNLKIQFKNAAELGAIAAADVPLIESSIKPMTKDIWDAAGRAQFALGGGKQGVLASLQEASQLSSERKNQAVSELKSLYPEYVDTDYFKTLIGEESGGKKGNAGYELGKALNGFLGNNFNQQSPEENPWSHIDTTSDTDILSQFN